MGIFKKKKEVDFSKLPELPSFKDIDDIPDRGGLNEQRASNQNMFEMPKYESPFDKDKIKEKPVMAVKEVNVSGEAVDIQKRSPAFVSPKPVYRERVDASHLDKVIPPANIKKEEPKEIFSLEQPPIKEKRAPGEKLFKNMPDIDIQKIKEKPVFVQLDNYRDAIKNIEILKQKIREIEYGLDRLNEVKTQEQIEISNCETSLNKIKERLIEIDKKLFEV